MVLSPTETGLALELLQGVASWRLVHPLLGPEVAPVEHQPHREWAVHNSHAHAHEEVFTLLAGTAHEGLQGDVYPVEPGTFFIFGAYEEHDIFWPPWSPPATQLWLHPLHEHVLVGIEVVDGPRRGGERRVLALPWEKLGLRCGSRFGPAPELVGLSPAAARQRSVAALAAVVAALARGGDVELEPAVPSHPSLPGRVVEAVCRHIRHTAGRGANLAHLAHIAGYSPFHFLRLFKQHTGLTVHQYIDRCRLERVADLQQRGASQKAIAAALGFSSPSTYSRWYHRQRLATSEQVSAAS